MRMQRSELSSSPRPAPSARALATLLVLAALVLPARALAAPIHLWHACRVTTLPRVRATGLPMRPLLGVESAMLTANRRRCARLRQSILKWAFEGKLVDQDPDDEPASALLARIKGEPPPAPPKKVRRGA